MNRVSLFNSPLLLGFEHLERMLDRAAKAGNDGYPPYNIEQLENAGIRITLAVAGFGPEQLAVTVENNELVIRGRQAEEKVEEGAEKIFLHRGIAARQFQRNFVLAEGIEVVGAALANGLLSIDLARPRVEPSVRRIDIRVGNSSSKG